MDMHAARIRFQQNAPHTFNAMQGMVMAMEKVFKAKGKKRFFGHDKERVAHEEFLGTLRKTIHSMILDGMAEESDPDYQILDFLRIAIQGFMSAFPNWPNAYAFAQEYFGDGNKANALAVIGRVR